MVRHSTSFKLSDADNVLRSQSFLDSENSSDPGLVHSLPPHFVSFRSTAMTNQRTLFPKQCCKVSMQQEAGCGKTQPLGREIHERQAVEKIHGHTIASCSSTAAPPDPQEMSASLLPCES